MKNYFPVALLAMAMVSCGTKTSPLTGNWIQIMPENPQIVQGVTLNADGSAQSIGMKTLLYEKWSKEGDSKIILCGKSVGNGQTIDFSDTLNIITATADSLILGKSDTYQLSFYKVADPNNIPKFDIKNSLTCKPDLGAVVERVFNGTLPAASCPGIEYTLKIYNQENSGDGVYELTQRYIEAEDGKDQTYTTYGKMLTLRGDATNADAVVYQLTAFGSDDISNFLYVDGNLEMLNSSLERANSELNYTLKLQK